MALLRSPDVEVRWYDGTPNQTGQPPARKYVIGRMVGDPLELPGMAPRPVERLYTDRGLANPFMARIVESDDAIFQQVPFTFTFMLNELLLDFATAIGNPNGTLPWSVYGKHFNPVTKIGARINTRGDAIPCPTPDDYMKRRWLLDLYVRYLHPPGGGNSLYMAYRGVSLLNRRITSDPPAIRVTNDCECWGFIGRVSSFPPGVEARPPAA